jgi:DNA modification methylase
MTFTLHHGDCIEVMRGMADDSVDSIVTDPPYELGFMGKSWDSTGIAYSVEMWAEALRVLKPGGHLLAFSGSRTYHRMACAIEDAGFEIRDQIMWLYGSGFPKSHNVSKGIDKAAGAVREVVGTKTLGGNAAQSTKEKGGTYASNTNSIGVKSIEVPITTAATPAAQQWEGWGTALKPAHEPIVLARKPFAGTVANNVLQHGTGALNIDGSRVGAEGGFAGAGAGAGAGARVFGNGLNGSFAKPVEGLGRWPANVIHDGSDEVVDGFPDTGKSRSALIGTGGSDKGNSIYGKYADIQSVRGHDDNGGSAARFFYCAKANKRDRNEGLDGFAGKEIGGKGNGLARTCATCGASVLDGCQCPDRTFTNPTRANHHPTVKPVDLMRYLVKLITPPGGVVLDPFMGSGSTGKGAVLEGFNFVGIEQDADYLDIARARIQWALDQEVQLTIEEGGAA